MLSQILLIQIKERISFTLTSIFLGPRVVENVSKGLE